MNTLIKFSLKTLTVIILFTVTTTVNAIQSKTNDCATLLNAIKTNNVDMVKQLLETADPNCVYTYSDPRTPLVMASRKGNFEIAKLLIDAGARIKKHDASDETPLMAASSSGNLDLVEFLIGKGASVNKNLKGNGTALLAAAKKGKLEVVKYLIFNGAKVDEVTQGDGTPLICAVRNKHYWVAKELLEHGANPNKISSGDESAMYHAYASDNKEMITLLNSYSKN